ncbi:LOW QUALITY PROTEIN: hypothetical protein V1478_016746 [Vespula squamosa]|uniref:Uncharacterized protein n=1 Tax=Vespula squamosa TaxID=30214 RepID=A0ABD2A0Q0_VESSQ
MQFILFKIRIVHLRSCPTQDVNKVGPLIDFDNYKCSLAQNSDECTSQLPRDAFPGSDNEEGTQNVVSFIFSIFYAIYFILMRILHSRSSVLRNNNKVGTLNDFVDFSLSFVLTFDECTSQLTWDAFPESDNEGGTQVECSTIHIFDFLCNLFYFYANFALAAFGCARRQQSRTFVRLCRFLTQFCFDFRRVHIAALTGCIFWK